MNDTEPDADRRPHPRAAIILVSLAAVVVVAIGMSSMRGILAPVLLTLVLTICANPVRTALQRRGVPGGIATGAVILVVFGLLVAFTYTILISLGQFVAMLPDYAEQFADMGAAVASWLGTIGIGQEQIDGVVGTINPASIAAFASGLFGSVAGITASLVIVLTMMILMAADAAFGSVVLRQLGAARPHLTTALVAYGSNVRRYMVVTTVLGLMQGALNTLVLYLLHVPAPLLWGLLSFLCSFIPNVGYFFALIPPLFFGFLEGGRRRAEVLPSHPRCERRSRPRGHRGVRMGFTEISSMLNPASMSRIPRRRA